jgi:hypothetical protein
MANQLSEMRKTTLSALAVGVLAGIPYFFATPRVQPTEPPFVMMALAQLILFFGGIAIAYCWRQRPMTIALLLLVTIEILVLGRIVVDSMADARSHSMAPFEFVLAFILCAPASFLAPFLGQGIRSMRERRHLKSRLKSRAN